MHTISCRRSRRGTSRLSTLFPGVLMRNTRNPEEEAKVTTLPIRRLRKGKTKRRGRRGKWTRLEGSGASRTKRSTGLK